MILGAGTLVRTGLLVLLTVVLQVSGLAQLDILGGSIQLVPLVVGAVGLYAGSIAAATTGFACGVLVDLALGQPVGVSSLVLVPVGYAAGRYRELRDASHGLLPIAVGAAAVIGYLVGFAVLAFMIDIRAHVSGLVAEEIVMSTVVSVVLALPVFGLVRKLIRPVLIDDPFARRRMSPARGAEGALPLRGGLEI